MIIKRYIQLIIIKGISAYVYRKLHYIAVNCILGDKIEHISVYFVAPHNATCDGPYSSLNILNHAYNQILVK